MQLIEIDGTLVQPVTVSWVALNVGARMSVLVDFSKLPAPTPNAVFFRINEILRAFEIDPTQNLPPYQPNWYPASPPTFFAPQHQVVFAFSPGAVPTRSIPTPYVFQPNDLNYQFARPYEPVRAPNKTMSIYLEIGTTVNAQGVTLSTFNGFSFPTHTSEMSLDPLLYRFINNNPPSLGPGMYEIPFGAVVDVMINNTGLFLLELCVVVFTFVCARRR